MFYLQEARTTTSAYSRRQSYTFTCIRIREEGGGVYRVTRDMVYIENTMYSSLFVLQTFTDKPA